MENLRKLIREMINEVMGVKLEINDLAEYVSGNILDYLKKYNDKTDLKLGIMTPISIPEKFTKATKIKNITIGVNVQEDNNESKSIKKAVFNSNKTKCRFDANELVCNIQIDISLNWDFKNDIHKELVSILSHELQHAFDNILRYGGENKSKILGITRNSTNYFAGDIIKSNPILKDFMDHFYLSLPEEINARVQEASNEIKHLKGSGYQTIMKELNKTTPMEDARKMIDYKTENVHEFLKLPKEAIEKFINEFNNGLSTGETDYYKHVEPKSFFNYWIKRINDKGNDLFRKLIKLVALEESVNEVDIFFSINKGELNEGYEWFFEQFDFS